MVEQEMDSDFLCSKCSGNIYLYKYYSLCYQALGLDYSGSQGTRTAVRPTKAPGDRNILAFIVFKSQKDHLALFITQFVIEDAFDKRHSFERNFPQYASPISNRHLFIFTARLECAA